MPNCRGYYNTVPLMEITEPLLDAVVEQLQVRWIRSAEICVVD